MFAERERAKGYGPAWITQVLQGMMIPYYVTFVKKENRLKAALTNIEFSILYGAVLAMKF